MLQRLQPKCGGLDLLAPIPISVSPFDRHHIRSVDSIYRFYKDSIANFSPNLNAQTVLLYTYKLFFNVKNQSFTPEYSSWLTSLIVNNLVLRHMKEQLQ